MATKRGERTVSRGPVVHMDTIKDSEMPRKVTFQMTTVERGGETDHHSGLQSDPK